MAIYRLIQNLSFKGKLVPRGTVSRLAGVRAGTIEILRRKGAIAEVAAPPLVVLPGWKVRGVKLKKLGIVTAVDFLEAEEEPLLNLMRVTPPILAKWREEVEGWLFRPEKKGG